MEFTLEEIEKAYALAWLENAPHVDSIKLIDSVKKRLRDMHNSKELWKVDFNEYLRLVNEAKIKILTSPDLYRRPLRYWPDLNVQKSLERSIENFWGTDSGWKLKIKQSKKVKKFDMVETLLKNIDKNKVFKSFSEKSEQQTQVIVQPQGKKQVEI